MHRQNLIRAFSNRCDSIEPIELRVSVPHYTKSSTCDSLVAALCVYYTDFQVFSCWQPEINIDLRLKISPSRLIDLWRIQMGGFS